MKKYYDEDTLILDNLIRYADHNRNFNRKFVDECYEFREKYDYLTENQINLLHKIFYENEVKDFLNELYG